MVCDADCNKKYSQPHESEGISMKATKPYYENYAQQAIIEALLKKMETSSFENISITEICEEANVARRTFYLYYTSKADVLDDYFEVLTREYDHDRHPETVVTGFQQIEYFFAFWDKHKDYLYLLHRQNIFYVLLNHFKDYLINRYRHEENTRDQYSLIYSSGGLWAVLYGWTTEDFKPDHKQLALQVSQLLK